MSGAADIELLRVDLRETKIAARLTQVGMRGMMSG